MSRHLFRTIRNALGLAALSASLASPALADVALVGIDSPSSSSVASRLYVVDRTNGAATTYLTLTGAVTNASFTDVAQIGNTFYASDLRNGFNFSLVSIDGTTGATTVLNNQGGDFNWHGLAANAPANLLYAVDQSNGNFQTYNVVTTTLTLVGNTGLTGSNGIDDLTYDGVNNILYGISQDGEFYSINTATGSPTLLGNTGLTGTASFRLYGLAYDAAVQTFYASGTLIGGASTVYSFTLATIASPTLIGSAGVNGLDGLTIADVNVVPEPASLAMALIGLATVAGAARLRRRLA